MIKMEFWDKETSLVLPDGKEYSPTEIFEQVPGAEYEVNVIEYLPGSKTVVGGIFSIDVLRSINNIPESMTDDEALEEIEYLRNNPPAPNMDFAPITRIDMQLLEQHITDLELAILEMGEF